MLLWLILYFQPFYFEAVKGYSPILAGVSLFPQTFTVAPASIIAGIVIAVTGRYRWATWSGWFLTTLGMGLLILFKENTSTVAWVFLSLVGGVGTGLLFSAMALAVQASSTNKTMSYAVILFAFFRAFGQTIGVAVGGVVFQNVMKKKLLGFELLAPHADEYSRDASSLVEIIKQMPPSLEKTQLLSSYMDALRAIYIVATALAAVALIFSLWTEGLPLDRALESDQGFKHQEKKKDVESSH
jgi:MFS family permease